jgi:type 1 glutamine amidotransferase
MQIGGVEFAIGADGAACFSRRRLMKPAYFLLALASSCFAALTEEQRGVPLEQDSPDPKLTKVVLIAGSPSNKAGQHEYFAGCALMMDWLRQTPGVWPVLVADGWPKNEQVFEGAKAVVVYAYAGAKLPFLEPARWARFQTLMEKGTGFVALHQAVEVPAAQAADYKAWLGGVWQADIGSRGHWDMEFTEFPKHPITRGVTAFSAPLDGWLFNLHFAPGAVPLVSGQVPDKARTTADAKAHNGRPEVVAWAHERPNGGRSFAFTGCDLHRNWMVESQRKLVMNGILWTAKVDVPEAGVPVVMSPESLKKNLDAKAAPKAAAAKPATPATPVPAQ